MSKCSDPTGINREVHANTGRHTDKHAHRHTGKQKCTDKHTGRQAHRHPGWRQSDTQAGTQAGT